MKKNERIVAWAEAHQTEMLEDLKTLCRIRSVTGKAEKNAPYGSGPRAALDAAIAMCAGCGFVVRDYDGRVMTVDLGSEDRALDILAHLDVVGEGDGWDSDPYEPVLREDGYIYGRGVADDKGGAIAALYALRCVRDLGFPMKKGCRLILGTDEESGFSDLDYYYKRENPAPHTFTPDAEFPVINGEKGFYRLYFRQNWQQETVTPRIVSLSGGFRVNVVPGEASAVVTGVKPMHLLAGAAPLCAELGCTCRVEEVPEGAQLVVTGTGCHAAYPELGNNANTALLQVLSQLPLADCPSTNALKALNRLLPHGDYLGKALGIDQEDEKIGVLTCSFTQIEFTPTGLSGVCDCRTPLCAVDENCKAVADAALAARGFQTAGVMVPPHYTPADTPFIRALVDCYEAYTGRPGGAYSMGGGTYVHDVPGGVAFGIEMPGEDVRMHGANERYPVADLVTSVEIFAQAVAEICSTP